MVSEYVYPTLGGVSEHVHFLSRELAHRGHDVTIVTGHIGDAGGVAELDRQMYREHGYRTRRIGTSIPVISNGSIADLYTILAKAPDGPTFFVVERKTPDAGHYSSYIALSVGGSAGSGGAEIGGAKGRRAGSGRGAAVGTDLRARS